MIPPPRILIVEDEPLLRRQLVDSLAELWPEATDIVECERGQSAILAIAQQVPDIAFLDINLPDMSGIDIATVLRDRAQVVFVTAYSEYAVSAFEQHALDYVLKPATTRRLAETVRRLKERTAPPPAPLPELLSALARQITPGAPRMQWITAGHGNSLQLIPLGDVLAFNADDKYTEVITAGAEVLIRKPIKELLDELPADDFWQIHRSTIVRVAAIERVVRLEGGNLEVRLRGSTRSFPVSRSFAGRFRQM